MFCLQIINGGKGEKESKNVETSMVKNRQTHVVSNDKAPEFEAVNFQTYDNPDGTKEHVLDIADEKMYPDHQMMVPDAPIVSTCRPQ